MELPNISHPIVQIERLIKEGEINPLIGEPMKGVIECMNEAIHQHTDSHPIVQSYKPSTEYGWPPKQLFQSTLPLVGFVGGLVAFNETHATIIVYITDEYTADIIERPEKYRFFMDLMFHTDTHIAKHLINSYVARMYKRSEGEET